MNNPNTSVQAPTPAQSDGLGGIQLHRPEAGVSAAEARELASIRTGAQMAMMRPRDEFAARQALTESCRREAMADSAEYEFPRGGQTVSGPSVALAREAARLWGNVRCGVQIVSEDDSRVHVQGFAWDLQTNACVVTEDKFAKLVQRKRKQPDGSSRTEWIAPDERDLRELVNKRGAICLRNAILQVLPPDMIDDAVSESRRTLKAKAEGKLTKDRATTIKDLVRAFAELVITVEMLTAYLGHGLDTLSADELAHLRRIYTSLKDGQSKREDHFAVEKSPAPAPEQPVDPAVAAAAKADESNPFAKS